MSLSSSSVPWRRSYTWARAWTTRTSSSGSATCHPTTGPSTSATDCSASTLQPSAGTRTERSPQRSPCGPSVTPSLPDTACGSRSPVAPTPSTPAISARESRRPRPSPYGPPNRPCTTSRAGRPGYLSRISRADVPSHLAGRPTVGDRGPPAAPARKRPPTTPSIRGITTMARDAGSRGTRSVVVPRCPVYWSRGP